MSRRHRTYVYLWLIYADVQQKPTQYYKAIILQLKKKKEETKPYIMGPLLAKDDTAAAKSLQSCPTLCDPIDGSPPGSPVPGTLQARTLEWVAISFSNA